jgi:KilA-N domain
VWHLYARLAGAQRFREALINGHQNLVSVESAVIHRVGASRREHGDAYAHRLIALHLAGWLEPRFEVWIYRRIQELPRTTGTGPSPAVQ